MQRDRAPYQKSLKGAVRPKKRRKVRQWEDGEPIVYVKKKKHYTCEQFMEKINECIAANEGLILLEAIGSSAVIVKEVSKNVLTTLDASVFQPYERHKTVNLCVVTVLEWFSDEETCEGELAAKLERIGCQIVTVSNPDDIYRVIEEI